MRRVVGVVAVAAVMLALSGGASRAWGPEGHRVIALLAGAILQKSDPPAHAKLLALLAADKGNRLTKTDLASEALWADALRDKSEEARTATSQWHSVRFKPDAPDLAAACFGRPALPEGYPASRGPQNNCVVDKVKQFQAELQNPQTSEFQRLAAVQFLLNLVADLNDPLEAIDRGDQGGACTAVQIGQKPPVRLSAWWEDTLVAQAVGPDAAKAAATLAGAITPAQSQAWAAGNAESWAQDSFQIAKTVLYAFGEEPAGKHEFPARKGERAACGAAALYKVGPEYEAKAAAALKEQLAKGGVRLAAVLRDGLK